MAGDFFGFSGHVIDGQFHAIEVAGEGGFSVVYRGQHLALREPVAIKCLKYKHKDPAVIASFTQRFFDESRIMYRLSQGNLNIVRAITTGVTVAPATGGSVPYMVLEWLEGESLSAVLRAKRAAKGPGYPLQAAMTMFEPAALAIAYAHSQGVVHRDIKPGNLFVQKTHAGTTMKVLDFGMAKVMTPEAMGGLESAATIGGVMVLSPQYVTPEQLDKAFGAVGAWTDVYAFALILVEALTAKRSRTAETFADLMVQITTDEAPTPRRRGVAVSDAVERVFERALVRETKRRYPDLGAFWQELKAASSALDDDFETKTRVDSPLPDLGSTAIMRVSQAPSRTTSPSGGAAGDRPIDLGRTMPLSQQTVPPAGRAFAGTMPMPSVSEPPAPTPPPAPRNLRAADVPTVRVVQKTARREDPPAAPVKRGRPVLVFLLVVFVALSLGASGLIFMKMLRS